MYVGMYVCIHVYDLVLSVLFMNKQVEMELAIARSD